MAVSVNSTMNLSCEATGTGPIMYQWSRVNGEISSDRAEGVNTSTVIISPVQQEDEDEYYCVASNEGIDGSLYNDTSQSAKITVYGKVIMSFKVALFIFKVKKMQIDFIVGMLLHQFF